MALLRSNRYSFERPRVKKGEDNDLIVTGVRVLIDLRCSNETEKQILSRLKEVMGDPESKEKSEDEICQQIENLFDEEFTSVKTTISCESVKEKIQIRCPFSIHITHDEESGSFEFGIREGEDLTGEEIMEVMTITVRRKFF